MNNVLGLSKYDYKEPVKRELEIHKLNEVKQLLDYYGNIELPALEQYGPVTIDECLTFVPDLVVGGTEDLNTIQKVKLKEHLQLLAQAFS